MDGFEQMIGNLISETEKAILNLKEIDGGQKGVDLLNQVQDALKNNDIDKLNEIIKEHGDITQRK